jgi:hypothetical protein
MRHCGRGRGRHGHEVASRHRQPSLRPHGLNRVCRSCDIGVVEHHSSYSEQNSNLENENSNDTRPENVGALFVNLFRRRQHRCLPRGFVPTWVAPMLMCKCEPVHLSRERSKPGASERRALKERVPEGDSSNLSCARIWRSDSEHHVEAVSLPAQLHQRAEADLEAAPRCGCGSRE